MKIKVGQYVRIGNKISKLKSIPHENNIAYLELTTKKVFKSYATAQELIEVGDLIMLGCICEVGMFSYEHKEITKILTPKGKDYICQWEVE
jgi:hypothetical protein